VVRYIALFAIHNPLQKWQTKGTKEITQWKEQACLWQISCK